MKALYRKYRPTRLEDVVGQPQVTGPLIKSLEQGKVLHAYLFIGPRGCGKTSVARIFAHAVNNFDYKIEDGYVDIVEIDGASNRGIDNIRDLREKVAIAPSQAKYKIYIIDEVHMLTKEAFNALLKTLEEPPSHAIFIMATTDAYKVSITITSRAQTYTFKLADEKTMFGYLKSVAEKEKFKISDEALKIIVRRGGGSFRDSLSLLEQISTLSDELIDGQLVVKALGLPQDEQINKLLTCYEAGDSQQISGLLKDLLSSGVKAETLAEEIIAKIIENPKPTLIRLLAKLPDVKAPFPEAKLLVALSFQNVVKPVSSDARLGFLSTSYAGPPGKTEGRQSKHITLGDGSLAPVVTGLAPSSSVVTSGSPQSNSLRLPSNQPSQSVDFDWDGFLTRVQNISDVVYSQIKKCKYTYTDNTLDIYPMRNIIKTILTKENNKKVILQATDGLVKITIHEADEHPGSEKKDAVLEKISDIMGGEVRNDGGESPF